MRAMEPLLTVVNAVQLRSGDLAVVEPEFEWAGLEDRMEAKVRLERPDGTSLQAWTTSTPLRPTGVPKSCQIPCGHCVKVRHSWAWVFL